MRLVSVNESSYPNLLFTYNKDTKSFVSDTGKEIITVAPGYGPFNGCFRVTIEDNSGVIFQYSELLINGKSLDDITNEVADIVNLVYIKFSKLRSISDIYHLRYKFNDELSRQLYRRF